MTPQVVTLIPSIVALVTSLFVIWWGTHLALRKERRQLLWSKELERFLALEELAGQLVDLDRSNLGQGWRSFSRLLAASHDMTMYAGPYYSFRTLSNGCSLQKESARMMSKSFVPNWTAI